LHPHLLLLFHTDTFWHVPVFSWFIALMRGWKKFTVIWINHSFEVRRSCRHEGWSTSRTSMVPWGQ
jgi:hypothetical protein